MSRSGCQAVAMIDGHSESCILWLGAGEKNDREILNYLMPKTKVLSLHARVALL